MRALAALFVLTLLFAGCVSSGDVNKGSAKSLGGSKASGPAPIIDDGKRGVLPSVVKYATPIVLGTLQGGTEPSIAAGLDGTVYVTTPQRPTAAMWRSDDGGKSYKPLGPAVCPNASMPQCPGLEQYQSGAKGGGDADIWVAPNGRVHWLGLKDTTSGQSLEIPYQYSDDKGQTWSKVNNLAGPGTADREWITSRADGTLFAVWRSFPPAGNATAKAMIVMRSSTDNGETWTPITNVAPDTRQGGISVDPTSPALALAHDLNGKLSVAHSFDNGLTWNSTLVASTPTLGHVFPVTAYDRAGILYLAVSHDVDGPFMGGVPAGVDNRPLESPNLYLAYSKDKGLTWSPFTQVNTPGTSAYFPWIAAGSAGRVVLVWYQNDRGLPRAAMDEVYVMSGITLDADAAKPTFKNVRISPDPVHRGPECREITGICTRSLLDFFEVAITPKGYPVVTWSQDTYPVPRVSVATSWMSDGPNMLD